VTWWTSAFDHRRKQFRDCPESFDHEGVRYRLLRGSGYARNISLRRIRDQREVARAFARRARDETVIPDVLFAAYPTVELADEAAIFAAKIGRPVVHDIRDLWPDIFASAAPPLLRPVADVAIAALKWRSASVLGGATAITGITDSFVEWGVARAGRPRRKHDRAFPLAFERPTLTDAERTEAERSLERRGVPADGAERRVVFTGSLSRQFDFDPVFRAASALRAEPVRFVVAGAGERESALRQQAAELPNVTMTGWLDRAELAVLLSNSALGLAPYRSTWDFEASIPNKVIEYLAWGLPVVSSLGGEVAALLQGAGAGATYAADGSSVLTRLLDELLGDAARLAAMSARARSLFESRFSAEKIYPAMADYLQGLAERTSVRGMPAEN
jgi:glycosyltransferase involved in cell wall biosynthesis